MIAGAAALVLLIALQAPAPAAPSRDPLIPVHTPYLDLVWKYLDGDTRGAIAELADMRGGGLEERVFHDLERVTLRVIGGGREVIRELGTEQRVQLARTWATLAHGAALLHLETGRTMLDSEAYKADRGVEHLGIARHLMDWSYWDGIQLTLKSSKDEESHKRLRRGVYLAIAYILQNHVQLQAVKDHLKTARQQFPDDAEVLLASGSAEELSADIAIIRQMQPPAGQRLVEGWRRVLRNAGLSNAETFYRAAVARDPQLAEAHLRLGRVLHQRGKLAEARLSLETARDLNPVSELGYLTALFLARLTEDEGHAASAFAQYQEIVKTWPDCHASHVALSRMYEARGDRQAALGALSPLWHDLKDRACPVDPWWAYLYGQAWRLGPLVISLRDEVRSWS